MKKANWIKGVFILATMIMAFSGFFYCSSSELNWVWRDPLPQGNGMLAMAWSGRRYVAVGDKGAIVTSTDCKTWIIANSGTTSRLNAIAWTGSLFVAVGHYGTIITSPDGINWTLRESGTTKYLLSVIWGNNKLVAAGGFGVALSSVDGVVWHQSKVVQSQLRSLAWTGKRYIAVGMISPGEGLILTSEDGKTWTKRTPANTDLLNCVTWNGSIAVAVCIDGLIKTSVDGIVWNSISAFKGEPLTYVAWTGKQFVACGYRDSMYVSTNGVNWKPCKTNKEKFGEAVWVNNSMFTFTNIGLKSDDGFNWDYPAVTIRHGGLRAIVWSGDRFVAVGDRGFVQISTDGSVWKRASVGVDKDFNSIVWTGSQFVAVSELAGIFTSKDGFTWIPREQSKEYELKAVIKAGKKIVAVGNRILTSTDGKNWTVQNKGINPHNGENWLVQYKGINARAAAYGNSIIVVSNGDGSVASSKNGEDWVMGKTGLTFPFDAIVWKGTKFFGFASRHSTGGSKLDGDWIAISEDGINWIANKIKLCTDIWYTVFWSGTQFVLIPAYGNMSTSQDGINWRPYGNCPLFQVTSAAWNGKTLVAVGSGILTCQPEKGF